MTWRTASADLPQRAAQLQPDHARELCVQVPYGYTPVLAAREAAVSSPHEKIVVRRFLEAAALGWDAVAADPAAAAKDVRTHLLN